MPSVGFEPAIPASEEPHRHALDRTATGTGHTFHTNVNYAQHFTTTVIVNLSPYCTALLTKYEYVRSYSPLFFLDYLCLQVYDIIWYIFIAVWFPRGGSGRWTCTRVGKRQQKKKKKAIQKTHNTQNKGKSKVLPITGHEGPEGGQMYSSTLPSTSALDEGGWSKPRPGLFTPRKEIRYPLYRRLGGPQGRSGRVRKISPPSAFDLWTVQSVASRCSD